MRDLLGHVPDDFDVLARRVEHLDDIFVGQEVEEGREIDAGRQRVDDEGLVRGGDLGHASRG